MTSRVYSISGEVGGPQRFTENLQLRSKLLFEANRELEKATRARSEFVSEMSHEFRKTLNIIIGFTELMLDEVPGTINQQQKQSLHDVLSGSLHLLDLVNKYLEQPVLEQDKLLQGTGENR